MHAMHVHGTSQRLKFRYTHPSSLAHFSWFPHCYMTCKVVVGEEENIYTAQHPPTSNRFITGNTLSKSCCCFYNNNTCYFTVLVRFSSALKMYTYPYYHCLISTLIFQLRKGKHFSPLNTDTSLYHRHQTRYHQKND